MSEQLSYTASGCGIIQVGMTSSFAVLGSPIGHSKSPALHRAAFVTAGIDATYEAIELGSGLAGFVSSLGEEWHGLSLTMPLKEQALDVAQQLHPLAISTRSANTLIRVSDSWLGYNTDVMGLRAAVSQVGFESVGILGNGATARSACVAFEDDRVSVWARNSDRAVALSEAFGATVESLEEVLSKDLVISTLPAGALKPLLEGQYSGVLLDVAYANTDTHTNFSGFISGLEMLLWQAVGQQRLFRTGQLDTELENEPEVVSAMRSALVVEE